MMASAVSRSRAMLDALIERRQLLAAEMRALRNGARQRELADEINRLDRDIALLASRSATEPGRAEPAYVTRAMGRGR